MDPSQIDQILANLCVNARDAINGIGTITIATHAKTSKGETLLLVEDDSSILAVGLRMLEGFGYRVLSAATPKKALRIVEQHEGTVDLLITDVIMPEMNGVELSKQLIALHPELKLLYMSGYTADIIGPHGVLDAGVNFLPKPFSRQELSAKVREVLES